MLGTFEKASAVLDLYTTERPEWGVTEAARRLGLPASSMHGLMSSLAQMGLLHRTVTGRYRLGFKLLALSQVLLFNTPWREVAQEEMVALSRRYGETLHLAAFDGGQIVNVIAFDGQRPGSLPLPGVGAVLPAYPAASAALLLAHRPWSMVRRALGGSQECAGDPATAERLGAALLDLEQIQEDDLATSQDDHSWSVAAPVRNHNGEVIAALSFCVPLSRSAEQQSVLGNAVQVAAQRISRQIGYLDAASGERLYWTSVGGQEQLRRGATRSPS